MKLFRKIREAMLQEGKLKRYFVYAIGEILLVMIGITLAFQVSNWDDNRIRLNSEIRYYENIRDQIAGDRSLIIEQINFNQQYLSQFKYAEEILESNNRKREDTLALIVRNFTQYSDYDRQNNIYETMVNSGEIKLLRNYKIVNGIQKLEEKYIYINRMENIHYDAMVLHIFPTILPIINFSNGKVQKPELLYAYELQNLLLSVIQVMNEKDKAYHEVLAEIENVTDLINQELATK